ncbi:YlbG family protein [Trichococcus ilyis]|uniref:UPF0298 protein SAMN05216375_11456 n=1 Tax=Trichococcus ilyis TaxID=640938 RepID=A0A143Z6A3_9LACT|nr:YlbG family protein [Trichococcus ilyis]CZR04726.1 Hypothetical protein TR210_2145 [Trichococcus ilyis]SEJ46134.1 Uncharacterized protein YlbG, UPF0298 family [Trichococcus ilyis]
MSLEVTKRQGIVVWVYTLRQIKNLKRYGYIHYVSNRMKYILLYVDQEEAEATAEKLNSLHFVRKVELSHRPEIDMTLKNALPGKKERDDTEAEYNESAFETKTYSF